MTLTFILKHISEISKTALLVIKTHLSIIVYKLMYTSGRQFFVSIGHY